MDSRYQNAIVMQGGFFYMEDPRQEQFPAIHSRLLLRCIGGKGWAVINEQQYELQRGNVIFMPWKARVTYRAAPEGSMVLCSCHIVPYFRCDSGDFRWGIACSEREQEELGGERRDAPLPGLEGVMTGYWSKESPIRDLTNYVAHWYARGERREWQARHLARLVLAELGDYFSREVQHQELSQLVQRAIDFIKENADRPISTRDLAHHLQCSPSTVTRHFREELGQTPTDRINSTRIERACQLLATSRRHVGEIARMVGVEDRYYFSKLFRRHKGITPTEYRQRNKYF